MSKWGGLFLRCNVSLSGRAKILVTTTAALLIFALPVGGVQHLNAIYPKAEVENVGVHYSPYADKQFGWVLFGSGLLPDSPILTLLATERVCQLLRSDVGIHDANGDLLQPIAPMRFPLQVEIEQWIRVSAERYEARLMATTEVTCPRY